MRLFADSAMDCWLGFTREAFPTARFSDVDTSAIVLLVRNKASSAIVAILLYSKLNTNHRAFLGSRQTMVLSSRERIARTSGGVK